MMKGGSGENIPEMNGKDEKTGEIARRLREAAVEGRVKCADAFAIARACGVGTSLVGRVANEIRIKIADCQLGCF